MVHTIWRKQDALLAGALAQALKPGQTLSRRYHRPLRTLMHVYLTDPHAGVVTVSRSAPPDVACRHGRARTWSKLAWRRPARQNRAAANACDCCVCGSGKIPG